jgi:phage gpG-like protein
MPVKHEHAPEEIVRRFNTVKRRVPRIVGTTAVEFFKENFRRQGFVDQGLEAWPPRQDGNNDRALLIKSGRLRRSIRVLRANRNAVQVGTNVPYAKYHNQGTQHLPQRQFIGRSAGLRKRLARELRDLFQSLFR